MRRPPSVALAVVVANASIPATSLGDKTTDAGHPREPGALSSDLPTFHLLLPTDIGRVIVTTPFGYHCTRPAGPCSSSHSKRCWSHLNSSIGIPKPEFDPTIDAIARSGKSSESATVPAAGSEFDGWRAVRLPVSRAMYPRLKRTMNRRNDTAIPQHSYQT